MKRIRVNILAEEKGYNAYNKEYRTLLVDQPLFVEISVPLIIKNILTPRARGNLLNLKLIKHSQLVNHESCLKFLETISQQVTTKLELDVRQMQSNYMILSHYLNDAANRHKDLVESYIGKFESSLEVNDLSSCDNVQRSVRIAVENYVIYLMHGKLMASVYQLHHKEESILKQNYAKISATKSSICDLGAQKCFINFSVTAEILSEIRKLPLLQCPISMVTCLIRIIKLISHSLTDCVRFERLLSLDEETEQVSICSDDLIASFALALARASIDNLYSVAKYLEIFGWSSTDRDQAAYCVATFQIVVQYILDYGKKTSDASASGSSLTKQAKTRSELSDCLDNAYLESDTSVDADSKHIGGANDNSSINSDELKKYDSTMDVSCLIKGALRVDWDTSDCGKVASSDPVE